uniref:Wsv271-like protein n=1 Tax=Melicertus latisulcatus pemonivirus TaxID=2984278 RepID=A0A9C7C623_9VIRU|nr:MAG: wsv271-like protein [Melicertus latisulcatus pemonivirus]
MKTMKGERNKKRARNSLVKRQIRTDKVAASRRGKRTGCISCMDGEEGEETRLYRGSGINARGDKEIVDDKARTSTVRHNDGEVPKQPIPTPEELTASVTSAFHSNVMNTVGRAIAQFVTCAADRYLTSENRTTEVENRSWTIAIETALKDLASYLSTLQTCRHPGDRQTDSHGLLAAFHLDRERALRAAMRSVASLYPTDSPARSAIARYSSAKELNLAPNLDLLLEQEMIRCSSPAVPNSECLRDLAGFRRDTALVFCGPVIHGLRGLKSFPADVIAFALTEAISFIEATDQFYWVHDDFPGDDFRSLLMGVNVRALAAIETDPSLEPLKPQCMDLRRLAMLQRRPTEPAGFLPENYSRPIVASDVLLTPGMVYDDLIVKASELLGVLTHLAAIRNLEKRGILCPGFFSAVGLILSHCIAHKIDSGHIGSLSMGGLRAVARRAVAAGRHTQQQQIADDSREEDDGDRSLHNEEVAGSGTARLMATVGGFFGDSSAFGEELRQLVLDGHVGDLVNFSDSVLDKDKASPRIRRLVGSLLDLVGRMKEKEMSVKASFAPPEGDRENRDDVELFTVVKSLPDPLLDRRMLASVYASWFPDFASRHVISVLGPGGFTAQLSASLTGLLSEFLSTNGPVVSFLKEITREAVENLVALMTAVMSQEANDGNLSLPVESNGTASTYIARFSPFGRDGVFSKNVVALTRLQKNPTSVAVGQKEATPTELIAPIPSSETASVAEHMKWHTAVQYVIGTPEGAAGLKRLADNTLLLKRSDSNGQYPALITALFGNLSESSASAPSDLDTISSCSTGLLAVAETCIALTPMSLRDGNKEGGDSGLIISVDTEALEKAIEVIVQRFQLHMAIRIGTCESLKPARVVAANRADVPVGSLSCKSSAVSEAIVSAFSRRYLSTLQERGCIQSLHKQHGRSNKADDTLIAAVAKRGGDLVQGQVALATVTAVAFAVQMLFIKTSPPTAEVTSKFSSTQTLGLVSSLAFLCVMTTLKAAMDMTRLSNPHFFSVLESLNLGRLPADVTGNVQTGVYTIGKDIGTPTNNKGNDVKRSGRFSTQPKMWSIVDSSPMRNVILGSGSGSFITKIPPSSIDTMSMLDVITSG